MLDEPSSKERSKTDVNMAHGQGQDHGANLSKMMQYMHGNKEDAKQGENTGSLRMPPKLGKILGDAETAVRVFKEYKRLLFSDEFQTLFNDNMDFKDPNVIAEMQKIELRGSLRALETCGMDHLKPMFGLDKISNLLPVMFMAYGDSPEVMKEAAFVQVRGVVLPPPKYIFVGDAVPNLDLVTVDGATVNLPDLHVNKDRPMMILASSAS